MSSLQQIQDLKQKYLDGGVDYATVAAARASFDAAERVRAEREAAAQRVAEDEAERQRAAQRLAVEAAEREAKTQREAVPRRRVAELRSMMPRGGRCELYSPEALELAVQGLIAVTTAEKTAVERKAAWASQLTELGGLLRDLEEAPAGWHETPDAELYSNPEAQIEWLFRAVRLAHTCRSWAEFRMRARTLAVDGPSCTKDELATIARTVSRAGTIDICPRQPTSAQLAEFTAARTARDAAQDAVSDANSALMLARKQSGPGTERAVDAARKVLEAARARQERVNEQFQVVAARLVSENCDLDELTP